MMRAFPSDRDRSPVLKDLLEARLAPALHAAGAPEGSAVALTVSTKPEFGDYQMNGAMGAAKRLKRPRGSWRRPCLPTLS